MEYFLDRLLKHLVAYSFQGVISCKSCVTSKMIPGAFIAYCVGVTSFYLQYVHNTDTI